MITSDEKFCRRKAKFDVFSLHNCIVLFFYLSYQRPDRKINRKEKEYTSCWLVQLVLHVNMDTMRVRIATMIRIVLDLDELRIRFLVIVVFHWLGVGMLTVKCRHKKVERQKGDRIDVDRHKCRLTTMSKAKC